MGDICSKGQNWINLNINGNGNSAFIMNSVTFNLTSILETAIIFTIKKYRVDIISIQLVSFGLILLSILMIDRYRKWHYETKKNISEEQGVHRTKYETAEDPNTDDATDKVGKSLKKSRFYILY